MKNARLITDPQLIVDRDVNTWVIGDLHGEYDKLMDTLHKIDFDFDKDIVISVGDLIDRGPNSIECLELLKEKWFFSVLGNHEDLMLKSLYGDSNESQLSYKVWMNNGGSWYTRINSEQQHRLKQVLPLVKDLPTHIVVNINNQRYLIAHADWHTDRNAATLMWSRSRIATIERDKHSNQKYISEFDQCIFGHTIVNESLHAGNCHWIDTGACFSDGRLTFLHLNSHTFRSIADGKNVHHYLYNANVISSSNFDK